MKSLSSRAPSERCERTDGADAEMELVKPEMKGEAGTGGRHSRIEGRSLSVCTHIDVLVHVREIARHTHTHVHGLSLCVQACASVMWLSSYVRAKLLA